jgi:hypothetical protein
VDEHNVDLPEDADPITRIFVLETTFPIGTLVATPGALAALEAAGQSPAEFLSRHARRDWGELDDEDRASNNDALYTFGRLLSAYTLADQSRLWIITEADRSATTLLTPDEY